MIGYDFSFNNRRLSDYGMIMVKPDEDDKWGFDKEILKSEVNLNRPITNHFGSYFSDVLTMKITIIKTVCGDETRVTYDELRAINRWLTSPKLPQSLVVESEEQLATEYIGTFSSVTPVEYNDLNGLELTFTCNSPYAFLPKIFKSSGGKTIRILCETDEICDYIYPTIKIIPKTNGTFGIENKTTTDKITFSPVDKHQEVILDGEYQRILGDGIPLSFTEAGFSVDNILSGGVDTGIVIIPWIRLSPGINILSFSGDAKFIIKYKLPVKIGGAVYVQF